MLARACGALAAAVAIEAVETLAEARGAVLRVTLRSSLPSVGRTVIVKRRDPESDLAQYAPINLATERRALELLGRHDADVAPRLIAADERLGMLVLSDVGRSVESVLFGGRAAEATAALVALGSTTGRLHRVPVDERAFAGLGTWTMASRDDQWAETAQALRVAGLPVPSSRADGEHRELLEDVRRPGQSGALVHGDLGPNNAVIDDHGACRLVDFEGAGFQHLGLDAAMLRFPFAWYGRWAQVPDDVRRGMERAYRDALGWPEPSVDDAIAVGAMAMAVLRLERIPRIADVHQTADLAFRRRTQIVSTIETAADAARAARRFDALSEWLVELAGAMRVLWPEARGEPRLYPAFETESPRR